MANDMPDSLAATQPAGADWALIRAARFLDERVNSAGEIEVAYWDGGIWTDPVTLELAALLRAVQRDRIS
jgi:hypothetical protein